MNEYEYMLLDGSQGHVYADKYEIEGREYVFYKNDVVVFRIPIDWVWKLVENE